LRQSTEPQKIHGIADYLIHIDATIWQRTICPSQYALFFVVVLAQTQNSTCPWLFSPLRFVPSKYTSWQFLVLYSQVIANSYYLSAP
jgi:hypothetical protein